MEAKKKQKFENSSLKLFLNGSEQVLFAEVTRQSALGQGVGWVPTRHTTSTAGTIVSSISKPKKCSEKIHPNIDKV